MQERIVGRNATKDHAGRHIAAMGYVVENIIVVTVVMDLSEPISITLAFYLSKVPYI